MALNLAKFKTDLKAALLKAQKKNQRTGSARTRRWETSLTK